MDFGDIINGDGGALDGQFDAKGAYIGEEQETSMNPENFLFGLNSQEVNDMKE